MPNRNNGLSAPAALVHWFKSRMGAGRRMDEVDYYEEGLDLQREGHHHEALTSFRLALKELPGNPLVLQQIAVSYTRIGLPSEAIKTYRHVIAKDPNQAGAHYGLAFLLIRADDEEAAVPHLEAFLRTADGTAGEDHLAHARSTLEELRARRRSRSSTPQSA